jgi:hypothetical protein
MPNSSTTTLIQKHLTDDRRIRFKQLLHEITALFWPDAFAQNFKREWLIHEFLTIPTTTTALLADWCTLLSSSLKEAPPDGRCTWVRSLEGDEASTSPKSITDIAKKVTATLYRLIIQRLNRVLELSSQAATWTHIVPQTKVIRRVELTRIILNQKWCKRRHVNQDSQLSGVSAHLNLPRKLGHDMVDSADACQ